MNLAKMKYFLYISTAFLFLIYIFVRPVHAQRRNFNLSRNYILSFSINSGNASINSPECGFDPRVCILKIDGDAFAIPLGRISYSTQLTSFWSRAFPNGREGFCAPTEGVIVISNQYGTVNANIQGNTCDMSFQSEKLTHLFDSQYNITSGTGKYANAAGTGDIKGWETGLRSIFSVRGNISY